MGTFPDQTWCPTVLKSVWDHRSWTLSERHCLPLPPPGCIAPLGPLIIHSNPREVSFCAPWHHFLFFLINFPPKLWHCCESFPKVTFHYSWQDVQCKHTPDFGVLHQDGKYALQIKYQPALMITLLRVLSSLLKFFSDCYTTWVKWIILQ